MVVAQLNVLKTTGLCVFTGRLLWYVNYMSIKKLLGENCPELAVAVKSFLNLHRPRVKWKEGGRPRAGGEQH